MADTKKVMRYIGLGLVAVGAALAIIFGSTEASIIGIASGAIAAVAGIVALIKSFK